MADVGGKVNVNSARAVCKIHDALKEQIHAFAEKKAWSSKQKEDFENQLSEFYRETIEETVKKNVCVAGKDLVGHSVERGDGPAEGIEPLDREKLDELNHSWTKCEDLIRLCSGKRKHHPTELKQALRNTLQCQKEILELFQPAVKSDPGISEMAPFNREDAEKSLQRLQSSVKDLSTFSKAFPELHGKTDRLLRAVQSHGTMQKCEADAVLFERGRKKQRRSLSGVSHTSTVGDVVHSLDVKSKPITRSKRQSSTTRKSKS